MQVLSQAQIGLAGGKQRQAAGVKLGAGWAARRIVFARPLEDIQPCKQADSCGWALKPGLAMGIKCGSDRERSGEPGSLLCRLGYFPNPRRRISSSQGAAVCDRYGAIDEGRGLV